MSKRLSISIPENLFERLSKCSLNISATCSETLNKEVTFQEIIRNSKNDKERILAEKREYHQRLYDSSFEKGRRVGIETAKKLSYAELYDLILSTEGNEDINSLESNLPKLAEEKLDKEDAKSFNGLIDGWYYGAHEVWNEIEYKNQYTCDELNRKFY